MVSLRSLNRKSAAWMIVILMTLASLLAFAPLVLSDSDEETTVAPEEEAPAAEPAPLMMDVAYQQERPPVPIAFVSRTHVDTLDGVHVGPPIAILGRETIVGGSLQVLYPDGHVENLTAGTPIYDVSRPSVSFDGRKIVFAGVRSNTEQWHIYEIDLTSRHLRQLTFDDRRVPIPVDPTDWQRNIALFRRYGDFAPVYLSDGRICFASTRYMSQSGSCGQRAMNLYVMNADGSHLHRITTARAGAMDPWVLANGRILYSFWIDNINVPALAGPGLRPLQEHYTFAPSFWGLWSCLPDGSDNGRYAFNLGGLKETGGAFQARELPDRQIVYTYRSVGSLLGSTLATAIAKLTPGLVDVNYVVGIGDPERLEAAHALGPAPLPDGRVAFAYTPWANVQRDWQGRWTARFEYGIYMSNSNGTGIVLLYDAPGTDELDPVAIHSREAQIMTDSRDAERVTDDPTISLGTRAILQNANVYADLPPHIMAELSPRVGTVAFVDVYDDSQTWLTSPEYPLLQRQMPRLVASVPVNPDGSFRAEVPADRPLLYVLRNQNGVAIRYSLSPTEWGQPAESRTAFFGHDYLRPGEVFRCTGCHQGHMIAPELAREARTNLARLAKATASSEGEPFYRGAWRVNDGRLADDYDRFEWVSRRETQPWVQLEWPTAIEATRMMFYPRSKGNNRITAATVAFSDGSVINTGSLPIDGSPLVLDLGRKDIIWARFTVEQGEGDSLGLAEWVVNGPADIMLPDAPPQTPTSLTTTQGVIQLRWEPNNEANLAGYKVHYGLAPGVYTATLDVGDVHKYLLRGLANGVTYYMAVSAYNTADAASRLSAEVQAIARHPLVKSITPNEGPTYGDTLVTIRGAFFAGEGVKVIIGGQPVDQVRVLHAHTLVAYTQPHVPGTYDVVVMNPDDSVGSLPNAFTYRQPESPATVVPTSAPTLRPTATRRFTPTPLPTLTPTLVPPVTTKVAPTPTPRR